VTVRGSRHLNPTPMPPNLQRPEPPLVIHLRMSGDPEPQIHIGDATPLRQLDLLQDAEGAKPARCLFRIEERIDGRNARKSDVRHGNAEQALAEVVLEEERRAPGRREESLEVLFVGTVHAAVAVTCLQVAFVQFMPLGGEPWEAFADGQVGVALEAPLLGAVRCETLDVNAAGYAGLAGGALGQVEVTAGAAKALGECRPVELVEIGRARVDHEILRRPLGEIAAGVRQGLEQADTVGHGDVIALRPAGVIAEWDGPRRSRFIGDPAPAGQGAASTHRRWIPTIRSCSPRR